ncbi:hypothetical protein ACOQFV_24755 [Nocardiopsis changdeensis]|uniref:Uncharacterized protein n=1 Tax=Nocardiopsis changdeensis TaxID=2831969 RepID=A0A975KSX2_9ACTN|nr:MULTISPECIES: hypothetical protein [Nocardiopsis]QUX26551.1 hypothetical protein KGD84_33165 [Nocardiopsis changdeensis]QYX40670.1 hypothetical protein K1J57_32235 [Nocardiopsis sp. MT53]
MPITRSKDPTKSFDLGPIVLFQEELVDIATIIHGSFDTLEIDFHDDAGSKGELPSDFKDYDREEINSLTMKSERGKTSLTVTLDPGEAKIHIVNPDDAALGTAQRILDACAERRGKPMTRVRQQALLYGLAGPVALCLLAMVILFYFLTQEDAPPAQVFITAASSALIFSALISTITSYMFRAAKLPVGARIINAPRSTRPTHWEKHRVTYISNTITGGISLLLGGVIGYFVNQLPPL